jgi:cysteinyl-tRNA synthetase
MFALGLDARRPARQPKADIPAAISDSRRHALGGEAGQGLAWRRQPAQGTDDSAGWNMLDGKDGYKLEPVKK